jgi:CHAT domain-containing protein
VPDGNLNLVQFAALVDGSGRYLLETYDLGYLTSGRELMRFQEPFASESAAAVIANPAFDVTQPEATCPPQVTVNNQYDFTERCFPSLPGTAREADELSQLLQDAQVWTGLQATEANLKAVRRPRLLHVATHGYFWPDPAPAKSSEAAPPGWAGAAQNGSRQANPMVRSGLILAGVKQGLSGAGEDGVLTAQGVAGLNLLGTKLVVLSACKTGLGDAQNGQGVYGLRRALVLAGSETQVMSLWKVSDNATQTLMATYYRRLQAGEGRTGALRQVQLAMLRGELTPTTARSEQRRETGDDFDSAARDYRHPYFWAAFIPSGDWRSMGGKEADTR